MLPGGVTVTELEVSWDNADAVEEQPLLAGPRGDRCTPAETPMGTFPLSYAQTPEGGGGTVSGAASGRDESGDVVQLLLSDVSSLPPPVLVEVSWSGAWVPGEALRTVGAQVLVLVGGERHVVTTERVRGRALPESPVVDERQLLLPVLSPPPLSNLVRLVIVRAGTWGWGGRQRTERGAVPGREEGLSMLLQTQPGGWVLPGGPMEPGLEARAAQDVLGDLVPSTLQESDETPIQRLGREGSTLWCVALLRGEQMAYNPSCKWVDLAELAAHLGSRAAEPFSNRGVAHPLEVSSGVFSPWVAGQLAYLVSVWARDKAAERRGERDPSVPWSWETWSEGPSPWPRWSERGEDEDDVPSPNSFVLQTDASYLAVGAASARGLSSVPFSSVRSDPGEPVGTPEHRHLPPLAHTGPAGMMSGGVDLRRDARSEVTAVSEERVTSRTVGGKPASEVPSSEEVAVSEDRAAGRMVGPSSRPGSQRGPSGPRTPGSQRRLSGLRRG